MLRTLQSLCGFAVFVVAMYSWLFTLSFINRISIYQNRDNYKPATYVVSGAEYSYHDGVSYWLEGTVDFRKERFIPRMQGQAEPKSAAELQARYPVGTKIDVLYNPEMTDTIVQFETLRLLEARPDVWEEQARLRWRLGWRVLVPVPVVLSVYLVLRYFNWKRERDAEPAGAQH